VRLHGSIEAILRRSTRTKTATLFQSIRSSWLGWFGTYSSAVKRRITNFKCAGKAFRNNQVVTVTAIEEGKIRTREGEIVIRGGLHLDQGIAVTSHAAQGKTVDQVIVSAPVESFSQVSQEQLYVSMSRARQQMHLVTDNKVALRSAVTRTSKRLSPWELINDADQERVMSPVIEQTEVDLQAGKKTKEKTREPELSPLALALARLAWESPNKHESQQPEPPRQSIEQERGVSYDR
jgi:hypothetical protein